MVAAAMLALTGCTGSGGGVADAEADTVDDGLSARIDEAVSTAMQQSHSTAAIVGVWSGDSGDYVRAYGDEELDANAQFRGAQTTAPASCAMLLDLAARGSVDLDEKVSEDLTRQVGIDDITYGQLCDGTSGLADFKSGYADLFANNPTRPWPEKELLAQALVNSPLQWPGLDVHISDTDPLLLTRALRIRTDTSTPQGLNQQVFSRANMSRTSYGAGSLTISGDHMSGYTFPSSGGAPVCDVEPVAVEQVSTSMLAGAGGSVTTVTDLKNFYEHYLGGTFGGDEFGSLPRETTPTANPERDENGEPVEEPAEPSPAAQQWGFGVENFGPLYGRTGAITGTLTAAYHDPDSGYSVVVTLNNSSAGAAFVRNLAFQLAAISAEEGAGPELPWTAEDQAAQLAERAVCQ